MVAPAIIALGGSLLYGDHDVKTWLGQLRQTIVHLEGNGRKIGLVIGGGKPARDGIQLAEHLVKDRYQLDEIGIAATRLNATILQTMLAEIGCNVADVVPTSTDTAATLFERFDVVVMGGTKPGHTTDAVSVAFARDSGAANVIIATNVSHVYTADPRTNDDAEPIDMLTLSELQEITGKEALDPGQSAAVDPIAVQWAIECGLRIGVLDGRDIRRIEDALEGRPFEGTLVQPE
ncbi:MAG: UMP kinase [Euryarchaeota archaeon]|nr:UMP kinase [Euryarchaeota archaeon]|tara:strand:+ start:2773 stop:3474 length:702 start_codon:yes stop_codon:yes gene_type:complete